MKKTMIALSILTALMIAFGGCATDKEKNKAKEAAAKYWQDKAYPGKSYDVQVIEAESAEGGGRATSKL